MRKRTWGRRSSARLLDKLRDIRPLGLQDVTGLERIPDSPDGLELGVGRLEAGRNAALVASRRDGLDLIGWAWVAAQRAGEAAMLPEALIAAPLLSRSTRLAAELASQRGPALRLLTLPGLADSEDVWDLETFPGVDSIDGVASLLDRVVRVVDGAAAVTASGGLRRSGVGWLLYMRGERVGRLIPEGEGVSVQMMLPEAREIRIGEANFSRWGVELHEAIVALAQDPRLVEGEAAQRDAAVDEIAAGVGARVTARWLPWNADGVDPIDWLGIDAGGRPVLGVVRAKVSLADVPGLVAGYLRFQCELPQWAPGAHGVPRLVLSCEEVEADAQALLAVLSGEGDPARLMTTTVTRLERMDRGRPRDRARDQRDRERERPERERPERERPERERGERSERERGERDRNDRDRDRERPARDRGERERPEREPEAEREEIAASGDEESRDRRPRRRSRRRRRGRGEGLADGREANGEATDADGEEDETRSEAATLLDADTREARVEADGGSDDEPRERGDEAAEKPVEPELEAKLAEAEAEAEVEVDVEVEEPVDETPEVEPEPPRVRRARAAVIVNDHPDSILAALILARDRRNLVSFRVVRQEDLMDFFRGPATDIPDNVDVVMVGFNAQPHPREVLDSAELFRGRLQWLDHHEWPIEDLERLRDAIGRDSILIVETATPLAAVTQVNERRSRFTDKLLDLSARRLSENDMVKWGYKLVGLIQKMASNPGEHRAEIVPVLSGKPAELPVVEAVYREEETWVEENDPRIVHFGEYEMAVCEVPANLDAGEVGRKLRQVTGARLSLSLREGDDMIVIGCNDEKRPMNVVGLVDHMGGSLPWARSRTGGDRIGRLAVEALAQHPERVEAVIGEIVRNRSMLYG